MDGSTVWLDIDQVASLEQNPKEHDIGAIIASMQRWGYIDVIGWNKRTGWFWTETVGSRRSGK